MSGQVHAPVILPRGLSPRYPLDRRLGKPHSRYGRGDEEKNSHHCPHWELDPGRPARRVLNVLTELPRFQVYSEEYKLWSSSLWNFLQYPANSMLCRNILLSTPLRKSPSLCSFLKVYISVT